MQMHAEVPTLSPYEAYVHTELQQYDIAAAGLVSTHGLLRAHASRELRNSRIFEDDRYDAWNAYCDFAAQLPVYTNGLMEAARYRLGSTLYGQDAEIWVDAHNFVLDHGYVPATISYASSPVAQRAMHAGLDGVVFEKIHERAQMYGPSVPPQVYGMSSYAANALVSLASDRGLADRLVSEADKLSVGNVVRDMVGRRLSEQMKGVGRVVVHAQAAASTARPSSGYYIYVQGAEEQLRPYAKARAVLCSLQGTLHPELHYVFNESLADVQMTIDLVEALRNRAWSRHEIVSDSKIYEWLGTAMERTDPENRFGERVALTRQILIALMNGDSNGKLPF